MPQRKTERILVGIANGFVGRGHRRLEELHEEVADAHYSHFLGAPEHETDILYDLYPEAVAGIAQMAFVGAEAARRRVLVGDEEAAQLVGRQVVAETTRMRIDAMQRYFGVRRRRRMLLEVRGHKIPLLPPTQTIGSTLDETGTDLATVAIDKYSQLTGEHFVDSYEVQREMQPDLPVYDMSDSAAEVTRTALNYERDVIGRFINTLCE